MPTVSPEPGADRPRDAEPAFWPLVGTPGQAGARADKAQPLVPVGELSPRPRSRLAPRVGIVVIACALVTAGLAVSHVGPFSSSPGAATTPSVPSGAHVDIRGTWNALVGFDSSISTETLHVDAEDPLTGQFSASLSSAVGVESVNGTVVGSTMTYTITLGKSTDDGTATVSTNNGKLRIQGVFSNSYGGSGTIFAVRSTS